ncbi:MAG: M48 family metalloprotease, partial [Candidatus Binatia bacterium]
MFGHVVAFVTAFSLLALTSSAIVALGLVVGGRPLDRLSPPARSRLLLSSAFVPLFVVCAVGAAMVMEPHVFGCRMHLCLAEPGAKPGAFALLVAAVAVGGVLLGAASVARAAWKAARLRRAFDRVATDGPDGARVLPIEEPEAFVLGVLRPTVYVSRGLLREAQPSDLRSVLVHESAHVRRRDPLRRIVASVGLVFHAPGVAALIGKRLARAQEMSADAEAARAGSDPGDTAAALVRFARMRGAAAIAAASGPALLGDDLEARVRALLELEPLAP